MTEVLHALAEAATREASRTAADAAQLADDCNRAYAKGYETFNHAQQCVMVQEAQAQQMEAQASGSIFRDEIRIALACKAREGANHSVQLLKMSSDSLRKAHLAKQKAVSSAQYASAESANALQLLNSGRNDIEGDVVNSVLASAGATHDTVSQVRTVMTELNTMANASMSITTNDSDRVINTAKEVITLVASLKHVCIKAEKSCEDAKKSALNLKQEKATNVTQYFDQSKHESQNIEIKDSVLNKAEVGSKKGGKDNSDETYREIVQRALAMDGEIGASERVMLDTLSKVLKISPKEAKQIETEIIATCSGNSSKNVCPSCKTTVEPKWKACPECGEKLH
jgi:hypothetical protein